MENKIKDTRRRLDGLTNLIKYLDKSRENSLAITSLELSKMWLGKVLKELGTANPYPESKNPENEKIEPTADKGGIDDMLKPGEEAHNYSEFTHIQKVKWLRSEIEKIENELNSMSLNIYNAGYTLIYLSDSIKSCIESGMWLGMELGRIRDTENK